MNLKWYVTYIAINVASCMTSIQKIPPKYSTKPSNSDLTLTLPSGMNSFPDVVYPTSILDIASPFYFNTDNNYEVLEPFSEDVKSSYKLLSSITKPTNNISQRNLKHQMEINEVVTTPITDAATKVSVEENIADDCPSDNKEVCDNAIVSDEVIETENKTDSMLGIEQNNDYNISMSREVQNESCSKIPLFVKMNIQVFNERSDKSKEVNAIEISKHLCSKENEKNTTHLKQVTDYLRNDSSEEINNSSEENYKELQDIKHSDFIEMLSVLLLDLLVSTDNATSVIRNETLIENESLETVLQSVDNLTNTDFFDLTESVLSDLMMNGTNSNFESIVNFTDAFGRSETSTIDSKEDYFLDLLVSLDSLCENNDSVTVEGNEYLKNIDYLRSDNDTIV